MKTLQFTPVPVLLTVLITSVASAQTPSKPVKLHVNPRWEECSFQLDPSLTQSAWNKFTREAGLVSYFRPLTTAKPVGVGNYELSLLSNATAVDETKSAWNDTFVHPDSTHWLIGGSRLPIPGFSLRTGITNTIDLGIYLTKNVEANYGLYGGQLQYNLFNNAVDEMAASVRTSFVTLFGPDDLDLTVYGVELLASRKILTHSDWVHVSAYAGASFYLSRSHEKSPVVQLADESVGGVQGMMGAVAKISVVRIAVEYNVAEVSTLSLKFGIGF